MSSMNPASSVSLVIRLNACSVLSDIPVDEIIWLQAKLVSCHSGNSPSGSLPAASIGCSIQIVARSIIACRDFITAAATEQEPCTRRGCGRAPRIRSQVPTAAPSPQCGVESASAESTREHCPHKAEFDSQACVQAWILEEEPRLDEVLRPLVQIGRASVRERGCQYV